MNDDTDDPPRPHDSEGSDHHALARMIDASANRLTEALRVVEDYARYALDDRFLVTALKSMRHDVTACIELALPIGRRVSSRDTLRDVGTDVSTRGETQRTGLRDVVSASFGRAQQAARSLEECLKTVHVESAAVIEQLRYRLYTLQKAMFTTERSQQLLRDVTIYAIVSGGDSPEDFESHLDRLLTAGVDAIQLREKRLSNRSLLARCRLLAAKTKPRSALAIINDRPDLAVLSDADGVHLGQDDLDVAAARRIVGTDRLIGVSTHTPEQAQQAVLAGADYLGIGPMFESTTKEFRRFAGPTTLAQVSGEISLPLFAIGGIDTANVDQIAAAGGTRVAVSAMLGPHVTNLQQEVAKLRTALGRVAPVTRC